MQPRHWLFSSIPISHPWCLVHTTDCTGRRIQVRSLRRVTRQAYHDDKEPA